MPSPAFLSAALSGTSFCIGATSNVYFGSPRVCMPRSVKTMVASVNSREMVWDLQPRFGAERSFSVNCCSSESRRGPNAVGAVVSVALSALGMFASVPALAAEATDAVAAVETAQAGAIQVEMVAGIAGTVLFAVIAASINSKLKATQQQLVVSESTVKRLEDGSKSWELKLKAALKEVEGTKLLLAQSDENLVATKAEAAKVEEELRELVSRTEGLLRNEHMALVASKQDLLDSEAVQRQLKRELETTLDELQSRNDALTQVSTQLNTVSELVQELKASMAATAEEHASKVTLFESTLASLSARNAGAMNELEVARDVALLRTDEVHRLQSEVKSLSARAKGFSNELDSARAVADDRKATIALLTSQIESLTARATGLAAELDVARAVATQRQVQLAEVERSSREQLASVEQEVMESKALLVQAQNALDGKTADALQLQRQVADLESQLAAKTAELAEAVAKLQVSQADLVGARERAAARGEELKDLQITLMEAKKEVQDLSAELKAAKRAGRSSDKNGFAEQRGPRKKVIGAGTIPEALEPWQPSKKPAKAKKTASDDRPTS